MRRSGDDGVGGGTLPDGRGSVTASGPLPDGRGSVTLPDGRGSVRPYGVVVVGGGPAGSAAAIWCAQNGLDVTLLEAAAFPRDRPGESLHPGVEPLFDQLGAGDAVRAAGFLRYGGVRNGWGQKEKWEGFGSDARGPWTGFQAWRADLDALLLRRAAEAGVRIVQPCRALRPIVEGGRVAGIESESGAMRARFTIDASGSRQWLRRALGIPAMRASRRLIATYGYARDEGRFEGDPLLSGDASGWTWVARVRRDLVAWTQLDFRRVRRDLPEAVRGMEALGPVRGADVTWRRLESCAGAGYFAIGDAASVIDPAASHGVLKAIMSGMLAGDSIVRVVRGTLTEAAAAERFESWVTGWFERDCTRLRELYAAATARINR